ncbi:MAG TPA: DNA repair protein RecO [Chitinophagaceae bacterium]|jgi:DNA repair protein RecO (recombination protein O)|nr:DNA repair protein RecO [Chitinophagaceae bacterium]
MALHATKGIVLRAIKYGETSLVVTIYTALFGLQSYLINGVRTEKKTSTKANMYQPTTQLELIVYHHPNKNLQRIKEAKLLLTKNFHGVDVIRYAIGIYMVELIQKAITETEANTALYDFFEDHFMHVLEAPTHQLSNFPILFTLLFAEQLGFGIQQNYSEQTPIFELQNGCFISRNEMVTGYTASEENSLMIFNMMSGQPLSQHISGLIRLEILTICIQYLRLHMPHLGELKSVSVLHEILN